MAEIILDRWKLRHIMTALWRLNGRNQMKQFLLHAMRINRDPPSVIGRSPSLATIRSNGASSWPLMAMNPWDQRPCLFHTYLKTVIHDGTNCPWSIIKFSLFRASFREPFDSEYSWCISASNECLKSKFDRRRRKKSHLELQFLSSSIWNEKPCIRWLIGSFRRLIWVRLRDFILIFHHLVLILHFK